MVVNFVMREIKHNFSLLSICYLNMSQFSAILAFVHTHTHTHTHTKCLISTVNILQVGNAVPPPLAKAIGHEIVRAMKMAPLQRKEEISV